MYDSCEIHVLQRVLKCVKSPMEQKRLHFPGGGVLSWNLESAYCTFVQCNLTNILCCANIMCLWYKLFKAVKHGYGVRHAAVSLFQSSDKNKSQLYYLCTVGKVRTCASMIYITPKLSINITKNL